MNTFPQSIPPITPKQPFRISERYTTGGEVLGKGSYAVVYKGTNTSTNEPVAIKEINVTQLVRKNQKLQKHLYQEIEIMERVSHHNHPNILKMHQSIEMRSANEIFMYIITDFCDEDLQSYLAKQPHNSRKRVKEPIAKKFLQQFASGLAYLRSLDISHRDLKPQNLLLKHENGATTLKIADFGFARVIEPKGLAETMCGSPLYMAPEILNRDKYTSKADLWSVGIILYEMLCGTTPFNATTLDELISVLNRKTITFPDSIYFSDECKTLIVALLRRDPKQRISWEEFWKHPWFGPDNYPDIPKQLISTALSPYSLEEKPRPVQPGVNLYKPVPVPVATQETSEDFEAAMAVLHLGDTYHDNLDFGRALTLYMKGLYELKGLYESYRHSQGALKFNIREAYLKYCQRCSSLVHEKKIAPVDSPEYLIFQAARRLGMEGATSEMAKMYEDSKNSYRQGYLLIQQMLLDSKSADFPIIKDFKQGFVQRMEAVNQALAGQ